MSVSKRNVLRGALNLAALAVIPLSVVAVTSVFVIIFASMWSTIMLSKHTTRSEVLGFALILVLTLCTILAGNVDTQIDYLSIFEHNLQSSGTIALALIFIISDIVAVTMFYVSPLNSISSQVT